MLIGMVASTPKNRISGITTSAGVWSLVTSAAATAPTPQPIVAATTPRQNPRCTPSSRLVSHPTARTNGHEHEDVDDDDNLHRAVMIGGHR